MIPGRKALGGCILDRNAEKADVAVKEALASAGTGTSIIRSATMETSSVTGSKRAGVTVAMKSWTNVAHVQRWAP